MCIEGVKLDPSKQLVHRVFPIAVSFGAEAFQNIPAGQGEIYGNILDTFGKSDFIHFDPSIF